jgi:hypothetical protein
MLQAVAVAAFRGTPTNEGEWLPFFYQLCETLDLLIHGSLAREIFVKVLLIGVHASVALRVVAMVRQPVEVAEYPVVGTVDENHPFTGLRANAPLSLTRYSNV